MKRNMSMSMYFNDKKNISDIAIPKTTPVIWIPSENVTKCYNCAIHFSILNRKHHCRMCGRVFCNDCSSGRSTIPSILNNSLSPQNKSYFNWETKEKRLCTECFPLPVGSHPPVPSPSLTNFEYFCSISYGRQTNDSTSSLVRIR